MHGLEVYVREEWASGVTLWKRDEELSVLWLRFPGSVFGVSVPVFFGVIYLPPRGSRRLGARPSSERMSVLAAHIGQAQAEGHVLLCGDFNAKVSVDGASGMSDSGKLLRELCDVCNIALLTGCLAGDQPAKATFAARVHTAESRPDHILASHELVHN